MTARFSLAIVLTLFSAFLLPAQSREPFRLLVITNNNQLLEEAFEAFEMAYGPNLLQLEVASEDVRPEQLRNADVIMTYFLKFTVQQNLTEEVTAAKQRGALILTTPAESATVWNLSLDTAVNDPYVRYWDFGGIDNITASLAHAYRQAGGTKPVNVPPPVPLLDFGIYHPKASAPFSSLPAYLEWYRGQRIVPGDAPLVGVTFFSTNWKYRDLAHIDALIALLEKRGIGAVAAFGWPVGAMEPLLAENGKSPLSVLLVANENMTTKPEDSAMLEKLGVHTINLIGTRQSQKEWEADLRGLAPDRIRYMLELPESVGATEPILFSSFEPVEGSDARVTRAVPERLETTVSRSERWIELQKTPAGDKRVALIYYNNPPGKGNVGASYLAVYPTIANILKRLRDEGYNTGAGAIDESRLMELLEANGRNIELWAPGELQDMVTRGSVNLVSMQQYKAWFAELPERYRQTTIERWGRPEDSTLMTVHGKDGQKYFVVPGMTFGNVFIGPQPLRNTFDEAVNTGHDPETPVPHQYVAAYLWYRHAFKSDAIVHIGRHGTLEWLPGKQVAQAGWDASEVLLGDVPAPYYYIMDGGGEAIQARRRSAATLIGHLTPMIANGGSLPEFQKLHDALENLEKTDGNSAQLAEEYKTTALAEIRTLKLDAQLGMNLEQEPWDDVEARVHRFLHDNETNTVPLGIHTVGELPAESAIREGIAAFIQYNFEEIEIPQVAADLGRWADAVFDGQPATISDAYPALLRSKIERAVKEAEEWLANLKLSPERELDALVTALNGRYLASGLLGDPLKTPQGMPTGRDLHTSDGALIPTRAAWNVGKKMADEFIAKYRKEHGTYPEKVSLVLWYGETTRHQGALESMAFYLMGVEPRWNARDVVDGFNLIPDAQLGRPRVDALFTISGIYRDGYPDKVLMLHNAARLAASAGNNAISRNDQSVAETLQQEGMSREQALRIAEARVFGNKPSTYGVGVGQIVERSRDADGRTDDIGNVYLHNMSFAFSPDVWGGDAGSGLANHLKGNQAVLFSRSTNLNGALDNDDTYQYFGGLSAASKTVNRVAPEMYINNLRKQGTEAITDLKAWLASELNTRNWNPRWLKGMQDSGYAGAREMAREMEYLYGFQATSAEQMDGTFWQNSYDVLVEDKHGLGMDEFFQENNPYARQSILARMIEVDRQGSYRFSEEDRSTLVREYVRSVNRNGISCMANTCGNEAVMEYIGAQTALISGLGDQQLLEFGRRVGRATGWNPQNFAGAPAALRAGIRIGQSALQRLQSPPPPLPPPPPEAATAPSNVVSGFKLQEQIVRAATLGQTVAPTVGLWIFLAIGLAITFGAIREWIADRL